MHYSYVQVCMLLTTCFTGAKVVHMVLVLRTRDT